MRTKTFLALALLVAWGLLASHIADNRRFLPDEAFFMTFARSAAVGGDWWLQGALDKPPLAIYANAVGISLLAAETLPDGVLTLDSYRGEFVGRLLSAFSGLVMIAVSMRLALAITGRSAAALAAGLALAAVPMARLYSASAFMDMPMLALGMAALLAAARARPAACGVLMGLAIAAKPQAVSLLPLAAWFLLARPGWRRLALRAGAGLALALALLLLWDAARPGDSVFALGAANNRFLAPTLDANTIAARFAGWLPAGAGMGLLVALSAIVAVAGLYERRTRALVVWVCAYVLGHIVLAGTLYERYLLPVIPLMVITAAALLAGSAARLAAQRRQSGRSAVHWALITASALWLALALLATPPEALEDYNDDPARIDLLARELNALPTATVIYDHWFGWLLRYYMGQWQDKRITYFPSPQALADAARALPETQPRYFILPLGDPAIYGLSSPWSRQPEAFAQALEDAGFSLTRRQTHGFEMIEIVPAEPRPTRASCGPASARPAPS
jgi:4-amino-4-deoxy-L-arabinose transferase-like glycosyltransferase